MSGYRPDLPDAPGRTCDSGRMSTDAEPRFRRLEPDARREQILAAAVRLFGERSYDEVSTTDLAQAAGVARGLLNHYFGTKRDLYLEVVRRMVTIPDWARITSGRGDRRELIDACVSWLLDAISRNSGAWLAAVGAAGVGQSPDVVQILVQADEQAADRVIDVLGLTDVAAGRADLRAMIRAYGGMVKAAAREWLHDGTLSREQVHRLLTTTLAAIVEESFPRRE